MCFKLLPLQTRKDAAALDVKTNVALIYLKRKKESVFMMLIYEKRDRGKEREDSVIIVASF